jgi:hypothetical protein
MIPAGLVTLTLLSSTPASAPIPSVVHRCQAFSAPSRRPKSSGVDWIRTKLGEDAAEAQGAVAPLPVELPRATGPSSMKTRTSVLTHCTITTDGHLQDCRIINPDPATDELVLKALEKVRYEPAYLCRRGEKGTWSLIRPVELGQFMVPVRLDPAHAHR